MSWTDAISSGIHLAPSPSESGVIAESVAHIWVGANTPEGRQELRNIIREEADTELLIVRFESSLRWVSQVVSLAEGRVSFPGGSIVYWQAPTESAAPKSAAELPLRRLGAPDSERAAAAIKTIFTDYSNHYTSNPLLRPIDPSVAYADWTKRSLLMDSRMLLAWEGDAGEGFSAIAVVEFGDAGADVLLAGVHPDRRGEGLYSTFLPRVVDAARLQGARDVVISTQDHNVAVQRLWARLGFEPVLAVNIVHSMHSPRT